MSNDPNIEIIELRGTKRISFRGMENLQRSEEELRSWVDEYEQGLIAIDDAIEDFDGLEQWWHIGEAVENAIGDSEGRAELAKLTRHSGLNIDEYTLKRYQNFYQMFPEGDYDTEIPRSIYTELAIGQRLKAGRKAYDRIVEANGTPRVYEVRAWGKCFEADDFSLSTIAHNVIEEGKTQTNEIGSEKIFEGTKWVIIMSGGNVDDVTFERVQEAILGEDTIHITQIIFIYDRDDDWKYTYEDPDEPILCINTGHPDWREATEADEDGEDGTKNRSQQLNDILTEAIGSYS